MKIAIVAPSPIPFTIGGAEKLWAGIFNYINEHTKNQCELIKVPTKENSFWEVLESYKRFYKLDLSHFDMVISGKYPAWMARHKNHHIYMLHTLRGLYDTYPFKEEEIKSSNKKVKEILNFMQKGGEDLELFFDMLFSLKNENLEENLLSFPGAFIKKIVHFLDKSAMKNIKSFSAISKTVANRDYYPKGVKVLVNYPPSSLKEFKNISYDYFFTTSRLDSPKRIMDIIKAYKKIDTSIPLKIAGEGPMKEALIKEAKGDERIEFLGFVSDEELIDLYAKALAVVFIPFKEDYGLVTIEAMKSQKCVITYEDSGGVVEFVENGVSGFVARANDIEDLSLKMSYLAKNKDLAKELGKNAKERVKDIKWSVCISRLLNPKREKIVVLSTYPIYPPRGGGQNRIFYLYKEIAKDFDVEIISLTENESSFKEIAPNLFEKRIKKGDEFLKYEGKMSEFTKVPVSDVAVMEYFDKIPSLKEEFLKSSKDASLAISSHPYFYPFLKKYAKSKIVYESHNFEYLLKKDMFDENKKSQKLLEKLFEVEKEAFRDSSAAVFCSKEDEELMQKYFKSKPKRSFLAPNGVDLNSVFFTSKKEREKLKRKLNLEDQKIALFIGSWHKPNIDAVYEIFKMADKLKNVKFMIVGSVGFYFKGIEKPKNVGFTNLVSDKEKALILSVCDVALNPMLSGSGTNLKMLDYMAAGIGVISTEVGARGLDIPKGVVKIAKIGEFADYIEDINKYTDIYKAREFVEKNYSWEIIAKRLRGFYLELLKVS